MDKIKQVVAVKGLPKPKGVWSAAITTQPCRQVFIAGMLAKDENGNLLGIGDISVQTEQVILNLQRAVEAAGGTLQDIVRVDVYIRDMNHFEQIHAVRRKYFPVDPPVSTMVEVSRMTDERALIEMNAIAVLA
ncbi:MAG: enamine deaminase RidA [Paucimonas sp.]|nr:enamine deaminase RidA [Paucimonas sp.]